MIERLTEQQYLNIKGGRHWTGNDRPGIVPQYYNDVFVSADTTDIVVKLDWRDSSSAVPYLVCYFHMDMAAASLEDIIAAASVNHKSGFRVRIWHDVPAEHNVPAETFYIARTRGNSNRFTITP